MNKIISFKNQLSYLNSKVNIFLLLFLILLSNSTYSLKLFAVIASILYFIILYYPVKLDKSKVWNHLKKDKVIWFYLSMISIGLVNLLLDFSYDYMLVVFVGIFFWLINLTVHKELLYFIKLNSYEKILNTLKAFVLLNFVISLINLIQVMIATNSLIPYNQMMPPPYGGMSGDLIQGFFLIEHLPNAIISSMLFIYFIIIKQYRIALVSLATLLLASSSLCTLIVLLFLLILFFFSEKKTKYYIVLSFGVILIFYIKINTFNYYEILKSLRVVETNIYEEKLTSRAFGDENELNKKNRDLDSLLTKWNSENKETEKLTELEQANLIRNKKDNYYEANSLLLKNDSIDKFKLKEDFDSLWQKRNYTNAKLKESEYFEFGKLKHFDIAKERGMIISFKQTKEFLGKNNKNMVLGNGMGNFSSILAFTSVQEGNSSRLFKVILPKYEHPEFTENHKALWKFVAFKGVDYHSVIHFPYSTYNTLLGEYGLLGLLSFLLLYIVQFFFAIGKRRILLLFMIPLFLLLLGTYYWFETFTFIMFFELIIYNEIRKNLNSHE